MNITRITMNLSGRPTKPNTVPSGVNGTAIATARMTMTFIIRNRLGRLLKNGILRVLMTKMTSVCVNRDSTNHADWNSGWVAWNRYSKTKKVRKSNSELMGPNAIMKFLMNGVCSFWGCSMYWLSTLSVGIDSWAKE
jgi:hypothetical protein